MNKFDKVFKYVIYFLLVFMPFREIIGIYDNIYLKFIPDIIIIGMFLWFSIKNKFRFKLKIYDYFYILFLLVGLLSSIINNVSLLAVLLHIRTFVTMYLLYYMFRNTNYKIDFYKNCLKVLMIALSILTILGIGEYITSKCFFFPYQWLIGIKYISNLSRMYTLLHSPNTFGYFAVMVIALFIYLYKDLKNKNWIFLLVLIFLGIILTQSRSSQIALVIVLVYWFVNLIKNKDRKTIIKIFAIFILTFGLYEVCLYANKSFLNSDTYKHFVEKNGEHFENIQDDPTKPNSRWNILENDEIFYSMKEGRLYNIILGFKIWKTEPIFGTGLATYGTAGSSVVTPKLYKEYNLADDFYSDNQYIAIIVESGLIGTILFLMFIIGMLYEYKRSIYKLMTIFLLLLVCMFYNVFELAVLMTIFYLIITMNIKDDQIKGDVKSKMKTNDINERKYIVFCQEHYNPLGLVRSLGIEKIRPIAIVKKANYGLTSKSKYISKLHLVDTIEEGLELLIKEYGNEKEKPFVLTSDDQMTSLLDNNYDTLKDKFIFYNAGKQGRVNKFMKKDEILSLAQECGLNVAKSWKIKDKKIPKDITYPALTKALISTKDNWKADSIICNNEKELKNALNKIDSEEILVQEYIIKKNELCYDGYSCDKGKKVLYAISSDYLYVKEGAYSNYMIVSNNHHKELEEKLNKMFEIIGFEGIFSVEFLVDNNDNYYFLEINFRNSTWSWASTIAGMNLPVLWTNSMLDKNVFNSAYKEFKPFKAMVEDTDFNDRVKTKQVSICKWIGELIGAKVKFLWYSRDLKPIFSKVIHKIDKTHY